MSKIRDAIEILSALGLPRAQRNERSALTLLCLLNLEERDPWPQARSATVRIHDILQFIERVYRKKYAENTRETIRRQTLHQFEQAGLIVRNPDDPSRPTNSPKTVYVISDEALSAVRSYGTKNWNAAAATFLVQKGSLRDRYEKRKKIHQITVRLSPDKTLTFSPGKHNTLQVKILQEFRPRFCPKALIVYVGDTAHKMLHLDTGAVSKLNIPINEHDKLPDVLLFDAANNILFLIEAVTSHGPLSAKRQVELEKVFEPTGARRVYISAFLDFREFKRHIDSIAWDTEVWIQENPDHMIHFNGPKFFNIYN